MTAALEPCPNPECGRQDVQVVWTWDKGSSMTGCYAYTCACGLRGPRARAVNSDGEQMAAAIRKAFRLWNALPRAPRLTSEPPTVPGFYWNKIGGAKPYVTEFLPRDVGKPNIPGILIAGPIPQPPSPAERSDRP